MYRSTWTPKVCEIMAFWAIIEGLGLSFYIFLGVYRSRAKGLGLRAEGLGLRVEGLGLRVQALGFTGFRASGL